MAVAVGWRAAAPSKTKYSGLRSTTLALALRRHTRLTCGALRKSMSTPATMDAGKAFLRKTNEDGVSVYSHLTEVLATLLETQPTNALDAFESVSLAKKSAMLKPGALDISDPPGELPDPDAPAGYTDAWNTSTEALLTKAAANAKAEEEPTGAVANCMYERSLFECAGVGLSEAETPSLQGDLGGGVEEVQTR